MDSTQPAVAVVVGAGVGIGMAVARRFGSHGFHVALVARGRAALDQRVEELARQGVSASAFAADVSISDHVVQVFDQIKATHGSVDVLEWGPWSGSFDEVEATQMTEAQAQAYLDLKALSTVVGVRQVLPDMLLHNAGTILVTTGGGATVPVPNLAPYTMAAAAERMYILQLHQELQATGVHVGMVTVRAGVGANRVSAEDVALAHWRHFEQRATSEYSLPE